MGGAGRLAGEDAQTRRLSALRWAVVAGILVFASAWGGIAFTRGSERVATIWIANAVLLAMLLKTPTRLWRGLVLGGAAGNLAANLFTGDALPLSLGLVACNTLEVLFVAVPLRRWLAPELDLSRLPHLGAFVLLAALVSPAVAAGLAALLLAYAKSIPPVAVWEIWYPADVLGFLVVTPLALMLRLDDLRRLARSGQRRETLFWFAALIAVTGFVFLQSRYPLLFLPMAVLGLMAVRLGPAGTALGVGLVAVASTVATVRGYGPMMLVPGDLETRVLVLQAFIAVTVLSKLPLTALLSTRSRLEREVSETNTRLRLAEKIAGVGHWRYDVATSAIRWSGGVYHIHGRDPATYTPTIETAIDAYHPDDRGEVERWVARAIAQAGEYELALRIVRGDGAIRDVVSRGLCETGPDGTVTALFGTIMDVTEVRQAERAVRDSEARYRLLADNTTDMITQMDLTGRRLFVSPGSRELLGHDPADLVGTSPQEMIHPDDADGLARILGELSRGDADRATSVNRLRHADGHWIWIEASLRLLRDEDGRPASIISSIRNIMDRRIADEARQESETRYRLLADHSSDLIALKPSFNGPRSYVSPSSLGVVGYSPEEFAALPPSAFVHPDDAQRVSAEYDALTAENPEVTSVHRVHHKSGRYLWAEVVFRLIHAGTGEQAVIVRARDITARHDAEHALAASEARYRLLADHTSDLIVLGHADGRRSYLSPAVEAMLGYTIAEAHGIGMRDWIHPDDIDATFAATRSLSAEHPAVVVTFRLRHKAGHYIWAEGAFRLVRDGSDATIVSSIREVTERVEQAEQLEKAKVAAESGARIKAEFLANMSHELRTPLTGMLGLHDLIQSDPTLSERQRRFVDLAQESGRALLTIVNDILDFSKIEAGQMAIERVPFSFREAVEHCRRLGGEAMKLKGVVLTVTIDPDVPDLLLGDPTRLRQVLLNLVGNAIKFTGEGEVGIRASYAGGVLSMAVSDTGIGIPADVIPHLFERFNQADGSTARRFGGTGLGLSISKRLIELMGGEIGVESVPGKGSTFRFSLPLASAEQDRRTSPRPVALAACAVRSRRILVAEDNAINREIIHTVLAQKGHRVTLAEDGEAAVRAFRADSFDVVLMDVQMPTMDGLSATRAIRSLEESEARPATPIVALTANAMAEEAARCAAAGMDAHVAKPIDWASLFSTIERLCNAGSDNDSAPAGPPILDEEALAELVALLGPNKIAAMLVSFRQDLERRLGILGAAEATAEDLSEHVHAVTSLAGQLGFMELSALCAEVQEQAVAGGGLDRVATLRAAADRALDAAAASPYAMAA